MCCHGDELEDMLSEISQPQKERNDSVCINSLKRQSPADKKLSGSCQALGRWECGGDEWDFFSRVFCCRWWWGWAAMRNVYLRVDALVGFILCASYIININAILVRMISLECFREHHEYEKLKRNHFLVFKQALFICVCWGTYFRACSLGCLEAGFSLGLLCVHTCCLQTLPC